jgi:hypothetical protein
VVYNLCGIKEEMWNEQYKYFLKLSASCSPL